MKGNKILSLILTAMLLSACNEVIDTGNSIADISNEESSHSHTTVNSSENDISSTDDMLSVPDESNLNSDDGCEDCYTPYLNEEHCIEENLDAYVEYYSQNPTLSTAQVVTYVNIGLDREFYTDPKEVEDPDDLLVLVNKYNYVPKDYTPSDLTLLPSDICTPGRELYLREEAAQAFCELAQAAKQDGYSILAHSTYRTYDYQKMLYDNYAASDGVENADTYSARPGYSEHHTGLAVDVRTDTVNYDQFRSTEEYVWMLNNAHKYGYVLHYLEGTQWITGYITEEWHFRYVGVDVATQIHSLGITFDEYHATYLN